jgi:hypothetical protein
LFQASTSASAFAACVIFPGDNTDEVALMPDANNLGVKVEVNFCPAHHPSPLQRLIIALASPVLKLRSKLNISPELSIINGESASSNSR